MVDNDRVIDKYEMLKFETLVDFTNGFLRDLKRYFINSVGEKNIKMFIFSCAMYFVDADNFIDGMEQRLIRQIFSDNDIMGDVQNLCEQLKNNGWFNWIEEIMYRAPRNIQNMFGRLGCCICASEGYTNYEERECIKKWL